MTPALRAAPTATMTKKRTTSYAGSGLGEAEIHSATQLNGSVRITTNTDAIAALPWRPPPPKAATANKKNTRKRYAPAAAPPDLDLGKVLMILRPLPSH